MTSPNRPTLKKENLARKMNNAVTKTRSVPKDKETEALALIKLLESCLEFSSKDDLNQIIEEIQPKLVSPEDIEESFKVSYGFVNELAKKYKYE